MMNHLYGCCLSCLVRSVTEHSGGSDSGGLPNSGPRQQKQIMKDRVRKETNKNSQ